MVSSATTVCSYAPFVNDFINTYMPTFLKHFASARVFYTTQTLLYNSIINGASGQEFHALCDNKGPTFTLVTLSNGNRLGGYVNKSWMSSGGYVMGNTNGSSGLVGFLVDFSRNSYSRFNGSYFMYNDSNTGPWFGGGDLQIYDGYHTPRRSSVMAHDYIEVWQATNSNNILGNVGITIIDVAKVEVYQLF